MSENPQTDRAQQVRIMPAFSRMLRLQAPSRADIIALLLLAAGTRALPHILFILVDDLGWNGLSGRRRRSTAVCICRLRTLTIL